MVGGQSQEILVTPYQLHFRQNKFTYIVTSSLAVFLPTSSMSLSKTLDEILKPEVNRPHRGNDFLLNLAYECQTNFGEAYQQYLSQTIPAPSPDDKVRLLVKTLFILWLKNLT